MSKEYECPECGESVLVQDNDNTVTCFECASQLRVDRDAEQIEGRWKDLTTLTKYDSNILVRKKTQWQNNSC